MPLTPHLAHPGPAAALYNTYLHNPLTMIASASNKAVCGRGILGGNISSSPGWTRWPGLPPGHGIRLARGVLRRSAARRSNSLLEARASERDGRVDAPARGYVELTSDEIPSSVLPRAAAFNALSPSGARER
ncbi:hypothetical protein FDECE_8857 [Fusarium decemcellulare]|nr:hypothetical protein FDECE_8857 [Fusarium decemcellulare]